MKRRQRTITLHETTECTTVHVYCVSNMHAVFWCLRGLSSLLKELLVLGRIPEPNPAPRQP